MNTNLYNVPRPIIYTGIAAGLLLAERRYAITESVVKVAQSLSAVIGFYCTSYPSRDIKNAFNADEAGSVMTYMDTNIGLAQDVIADILGRGVPLSRFNQFLRYSGHSHPIHQSLLPSKVLVSTKNWPQEQFLGKTAWNTLLQKAEKTVADVGVRHCFEGTFQEDPLAGMCAGMSQSFILEYFTHREKGDGVQDAARKAAEHLANGATEEACLLQIIRSNVNDAAIEYDTLSIGLEGNFLRLVRHDGDGCGLQTDTDYIQGDAVVEMVATLGDGIHRVSLGFSSWRSPPFFTHSIVLIKEGDLQFVFDPSWGLSAPLSIEAYFRVENGRARHPEYAFYSYNNLAE